MPKQPDLNNDSELLAELQENYDYTICGKLFYDVAAGGNLFCTREEGHEGGHEYDS